MSIILAIESSCDETSAAVLQGKEVLSNVISSQLEHRHFGGVVPEIASRLHQQHIITVIQEALSKAAVKKTDLEAIAFTRGPGLLGALLVGTSFAKSFAYALGLPLIEVNHMEAHVLANFLVKPEPAFPFLCLTVSGGHTQLVLVRSPLDMSIIGATIDDAAGEAFDKAAKIMGLPYPGGPEIDRLAREGNSQAFEFPTPQVGKFDFSFSGLKTSLLYQIKDGLAEDDDFLEKNRQGISASYQHKIVTILLEKLELAAQEHQVKNLAIAGGVSANSELRERFRDLGKQQGWTTHIPPFEYCTDNAAMIGMAAYFKFENKQFAPLDVVPFTRTSQA